MNQTSTGQQSRLFDSKEQARAELARGVEFVRDKKTKEPLSKKVTYKIFQECVRRGLLTMSYEAKFRIQPSMTIDEATIDESVEIITEVLNLIKTSGEWKQA